MLCLPVKYRRIFPVESLSKVENPWKGFTLNRCILVAMVIVVVSSGLEIVQETIEPYFEVTEDEPGSELQADDLTAEPDSWWDTFAFWNWRSEDEIEEFRKKRAARQRQDGDKVGPRKIRNKEMAKGLLKERE
ncbi:hypothetical protein DPX16_9790 [Anabarilius grahami]|uniref:Uncharacterized protein n=1 Tax=Anabarilius grahami TaxID=495550 RepID=A0A3N0Y3L7_ANAGA|nr:hypothetical protein DPX16_9790 [Anabarilius grahami]